MFDIYFVLCLLGQTLHPVGHFAAGLLLLLGDGTPRGSEGEAQNASHPSPATQGDQSQALDFKFQEGSCV